MLTHDTQHSGVGAVVGCKLQPVNKLLVYFYCHVHYTVSTTCLQITSKQIQGYAVLPMGVRYLIVSAWYIVLSEPLAFQFQSSATRSAARNTLVLPVLRDFAAPLFPPFPRPLEAPRVEPEPREKDAFRLEPRLSPTETQRSGQSDQAKISTG
jgi:hypothetical protein